MGEPVDLDPAARTLQSLLDGLTDEELSNTTPCEGLTVGDLLDHLMSLSVAFRHAADKDLGPATSGSPPPPSAANLDRHWRTILPGRLAELVAAWRDRAAWEGTTQVGGVTMPAATVGAVALNELVIHGWDVARGTGRPFGCDDASAAASFALLSEIGDMMRPDALGPVVPVPADAPFFERALGLSGRDPSWGARR